MSVVKYITKKRFKGLGISGSVNLPYGTVCEANTGYICYGGKPICGVTSESAYQHFAIDNDGQGLLRGKLIGAIQKSLAIDSKLKSNEEMDLRREKWDKVWEDKICNKYRRADYSGHWLWGHAFFNAPIVDLEYIARLVCADLAGDK